MSRFTITDAPRTGDWYVIDRDLEFGPEYGGTLTGALLLGEHRNGFHVGARWWPGCVGCAEGPSALPLPGNPTESQTVDPNLVLRTEVKPCAM